MKYDITVNQNELPQPGAKHWMGEDFEDSEINNIEVALKNKMTKLGDHVSIRRNNSADLVILDIICDEQYETDVFNALKNIQ